MSEKMEKGSAQERVIFAHFKLYSKKSFNKPARATVGFFLDKQVSTLYYGIAWYSPNSPKEFPFIRKEGVKMARKRIGENFLAGIGIPNFRYNGKHSYYEVCHTLLKLEMASDNAPHWAKEYKFTEAGWSEAAEDYPVF